MNIPLCIIPEDIRTCASRLGILSENAHHVQDTLTRTWARLDSGWEDYAESGIQDYYRDAMNELSRTAAMLGQMEQALINTTTIICEMDSATIFDLLVNDATNPAAGSGNDMAGLFPKRQGPDPTHPTPEEIQGVVDTLLEKNGEYRNTLESISVESVYLVNGQEETIAISGTEVLELLETVEIVIGPPPGGFKDGSTIALWNYEDGKIYINPDQCAGISNEALMAVLIHEAVHAVQESELGPYDENQLNQDCGMKGTRDNFEDMITREYVAYSFEVMFWEEFRNKVHENIANLPDDSPDSAVEGWYTIYEQGELKDSISDMIHTRYDSICQAIELGINTNEGNP